MSLELNLNNIENKLSYLSLYPVVWPGLLKVGIGITQLVTAVAISVIFFVPACLHFEDSQKLFCRAIKHIGHGMGNIVAGAIEAIPLAGTLFFIIRKNRPPYSPYNYSRLLMKHPKFKFLPYDHNTLELYLKEKKEFLLKDPESHNLTVAEIHRMTR
jgi:hypothetical protein